jgi:hypothetical protein
VSAKELDKHVMARKPLPDREVKDFDDYQDQRSSGQFLYEDVMVKSFRGSNAVCPWLIGSLSKQSIPSGPAY